VADNLRALVRERNLPHYDATIGDRSVLHVVVDLGRPETTQDVRAIMRRVGEQTIELNFKAPTPGNRWGHVAVRVGDATTYDLTGTQGIAELPALVKQVVNLIQGSDHATFARRRNPRRFLEGRQATPGSAAVYYGYLFSATERELAVTDRLYSERLAVTKSFKVHGGDSSKGEYNCAQFLTEGVCFLKDRGIAPTISASRAGTTARRSPKLDAVVVYKLPDVPLHKLKGAPRATGSSR
jgi:hypothetical protein